MRMLRLEPLPAGRLAAGVALLFTLAGCADNSGGSPQAEPDPPVEAAPAEPPRGGAPGFPETPSGAPAGVVGEEGDATLVSATLTEWGVRLSRDSLPAGPVRITVVNQGQRSHRAEVRSQHTGRWVTPAIPPGGSVTLSMALLPAAYDVFCPDEDDAGSHSERGMSGRLRVF